VQTLLRERFLEVEDEEDEFKEVGMSDSAVAFVPPSADAMAGLVICGSAIKRVGAVCADAGAQLPGSTNQDEDVLMDGILEETGAVFGVVGATPNFSVKLACGAAAGYASEASALDDPKLATCFLDDEGLLDFVRGVANHSRGAQGVNLDTVIEVC
jgi:hypothetical protein